MAPDLCPAASAHSGAHCFLGHLSEVSSPWPLPAAAFLRGGVCLTTHPSLEAAPETVPGCVNDGSGSDSLSRERLLLL